MMRFSRRQFMVASGLASVGAAGISSCSTPPLPTPVAGCAPPVTGPVGPMALPGTAGLIEETWFQQRAASYLSFATQTLTPSSETSIAAHLLRARNDPTFTWEPGDVTVDGLSGTWEMLDGWKDTGDFRLMYLHWVHALGTGVLNQNVLDEIKRVMLGCRYRHDDPLPADRLDHKWFWSENHQLIFAVIEFLAGRAFPEDTFEVTGMSGAQHAQRARPRILTWITERSRFGFSEWHSNVYMLKNITPLLTVIELSDDEELIGRCTGALDICLADIAMHTQAGSYGATHGRTYKKDKMTAVHEDTFGTAKLLFDDTDRDWPSASDSGATYLAGAARYRMPEVIRRIARSEAVTSSTERHGVPIDPHEPLSVNPQAAFGYDYDDPDNLAFWWGQGALTSWQLVPGTLAAAKKWRLWETDLFKDLSAIEPIAQLGPAAAQLAAHELAPMAAFGVLSEAHTYTWRSPEAMLSTVVDHRSGDARDQIHSWQATIDPDALVFTTHPQKPTPQSLEWRDDAGYWTGTASQPRSIQCDNVGIHIYAPAYASPDDPLLGPTFGYLHETHAYFPQDHFDVVTQAEGWTFGKKGDAYIALWSQRPTTWREYDPAVVATNGMVKPFDLVAEGSAENVWIVEVGRRADVGTFDQFVSSVSAAPLEASRPKSGPRVRYESPSVGALEFSWRGELLVDGAARTVGEHERLSSPWGDVCYLGEFLQLAEGGAELRIDFAKGTREVRA